MSETLANSVLFMVYLFGIVPLIGVLFGGGHCTYGENDKYDNSMYRGLLVHLVAGCFYMIVVAIHSKIY